MPPRAWKHCRPTPTRPSTCVQALPASTPARNCFPPTRCWHRASGTSPGAEFYIGLEDNAVSGGDVWLLGPSTRTLLAGDLVNFPAPFFDTACPRGWSEALGRLDAQPFEMLVPGMAHR